MGGKGWREDWGSLARGTLHVPLYSDWVWLLASIVTHLSSAPHRASSTAISAPRGGYGDVWCGRPHAGLSPLSVATPRGSAGGEAYEKGGEEAKGGEAEVRVGEAMVPGARTCTPGRWSGCELWRQFWQGLWRERA